MPASHECEECEKYIYIITLYCKITEKYAGYCPTALGNLTTPN